MKKYVVSGVIIFVFVGLASWFAREYGLYYTHWYVDIILHVLSGVGFGCFWVALTRKSVKARLPIILGAISFAVLGSLVWELWEFAGWRIMPGGMRYYIPELGDTISDMFCGALGGLMASVWRVGK